LSDPIIAVLDVPAMRSPARQEQSMSFCEVPAWKHFRVSPDGPVLRKTDRLLLKGFRAETVKITSDDNRSGTPALPVEQYPDEDFAVYPE
jgi:hypothetical protein